MPLSNVYLSNGNDNLRTEKERVDATERTSRTCLIVFLTSFTVLFRMGRVK
jgi:hypothetical protein